jgi:hypothetical protein
MRVWIEVELEFFLNISEKKLKQLEDKRDTVETV